MGGRGKLPVLLTELVLMLLIFSLCAAVCLSIFASARASARESAALSQATVWAQSAAEAYRAARGDAVAAGGALGADTQSDGFMLYLGEDWARTSAGEGVYCLTLRETGKHAAAVLVSGAEGERIFSLNVKAVAYG